MKNKNFSENEQEKFNKDVEYIILIHIEKGGMSLVKELLDYDTVVNIISTIPSCIFYKDRELRYVFSTHYWNQLNGYNSEDFDIYGKTDLEIRKDKQNARHATRQDKRILKTGKGCRYVIKSDVDDKLQYLEIIKEPVRNNDGEIIGIVGLINDVTDKTMLEERAKRLAEIDNLTNVYNRQTGTEIIQKSLKKSVKGKMFCVVDVNKFKLINDTYGHNVGDIALVEIARTLRKFVRSNNDIVMRLGGDEFVIFLQDIEGETAETAEAMMQRLFSLVSKIKIKGYPEIKISLSIGLEKVVKGSTFDSLYVAADTKMYKAKAMLKNSYVI